MAIPFLILAAGVLNFILGTLIIISGKGTRSRFLFAFFSYSTFFWSLSNFLIYVTPVPLFIRLSYASATLIPILLLAWVYNYSPVKNRRIFVLLASILSLIGVIFFILPIFGNLVISGISANNTGELVESFGLLFPVYVSFFILSFYMIIAKLIRLHRSASFENKKQLKFVILGISIFSILAILFGLVFPLLGFLKFLNFDAPSSIFFTIFIFIAIIRYKWMNVKIVTSQLLITCLWVLIAVQYLLMEKTETKLVSLATFIVSLIIGFISIKSINLEIQRKDELENLSNQLSEANDKLHALDRAKSEFISIASHQLRTPLTSIKGFVSLLLEGTYGVVDDIKKAALEKVYISNERLIQLVEDLLNISRIEAGRMEFDFQEAQIEDLVVEVVNTLELAAKAKDLYLNYQKPEEPMPKIKIDITKIKEVISNMVDNSIKYTQKGGVTVRITDHLTPKEEGGFGKVIQVIVSDTGIGMDAEDLQMIFEKFQRGKQVSHYHTDGTGLGMYIGKKVVDVHKGRLWAESDGKNKGSRFILELPVLAAADLPDSSQQNTD
jgi:signal transduction histidine kinase